MIKAPAKAKIMIVVIRQLLHSVGLMAKQVFAYNVRQ